MFGTPPFVFATVIVAALGYVSGTVLIADMTMSNMIELTTRPPFCFVHKDRGTIRDMLLSSDPRKVRQMTDESIAKLVDVCKNNGVQSAHQGGFIYPGTKWCGPGTNAKNYTDLGKHLKEDLCCREHDNCANNLKSGECRHGICNDSAFTRSHCDCDATFRRCLQNVNTETANTIGAIFFNIVQVICFKERTPCSPQQSDIITAAVDARCIADFYRSPRYQGSYVQRFSWRNKKEHFINIFLRKFMLLNGYTQAEGDTICAQWHYRPSEKYIPLMPLP